MVTGSARGTTFRRRGMAPALAIVMVFVSACGSAESGSQGEYSDEHGSVSLAHVHGLGVNPADSTLYVASHHGLFRVTGDAAPEQVAGRTQDFMGFTVVGPDHFLGSGHPGPGDADQPSHLGLIESRDAGLTWTPVSLSGEADFHAMEAEHDRVYGYDSVSGQIMVSTDRKTWDRRARLGLADIAVSPGRAWRAAAMAGAPSGPSRMLRPSWSSTGPAPTGSWVWARTGASRSATTAVRHGVSAAAFPVRHRRSPVTVSPMCTSRPRKVSTDPSTAAGRSPCSTSSDRRAPPQVRRSVVR